MSKVSQLDKVLTQLEGERQIIDLAIAKIKSQITAGPKRPKKVISVAPSREEYERATGKTSKGVVS